MRRVFSSNVIQGFFLLVLCLSQLSLSCPLHGEGKEDMVYLRRLWRAEDGLRNQVVRAITQSEEGYLWLATDEGLVRFDGARFSEFDNRTVKEKPSRWVVDVIEGEDGSIWASSSNGGVTRIKEGELTRYTVADGLDDNVILALHEDRQGRVWLGSATGLTRYEDGEFYTYPTANGWEPRAIRNFAEDREGNLWLGTSLGLGRLRNGEVTIYTKEEGWLTDDSVMALLVDREENLWVGTAAGLTVLGSDGTKRHYTTDDGLAGPTIRGIYQDRAGKMWIGSDGGLQEFRDGEFIDVTFRERGSDEPAQKFSAFVYTIFEDHEGTLWVGTYLGLNQINVPTFKTFSMEEGLPENVVTTVREDRAGGMWVGTWGGGLSRVREGEVTTWTGEDGLPSDHVLALGQDQAGDLWVGTDGFGVSRFSGGVFDHYPLAGGRSENTIRVIHEDSQGRLWAGGNSGLNLLVDGVFRPTEELFGLNLQAVAVIREDAAGALWIGSADGLTRLDGREFRTFTSADGLSSTIVTMIYPDTEGVVWVGTEGGGLNRLAPDGSIFVYKAESGLFRERILHLLEDDSGYFWLSSRSGIFRVSKKELNDFAAGKTGLLSPIVYGKADGMKRAQCNGIAQPSGWRSKDERLWFPTMDGLVIFDPSRARMNAQPPPVVIERVLVDGEEVPLEDGLRIPPGTGRLEIKFTALSFQVPERVRFRYMLEGFDTKWQDGGSDRTAVYQNLPPDRFRFRVTASNNDGVWNEDGAAFGFVSTPHFYQTYWFYLLCALVLTSSGAGAYGLRVRWMRRRHQELSRLVDERTQKLQEQIGERMAAQRRTSAFSRLGQQLSLASTQVEAAETIVAIADELIGWDSCGLHAYASETDAKTPVLLYDLVDGQRVKVGHGTEGISPMMRKTIDEGPQLLLRKESEFESGFVPFGDVNRPSVSLMYAPMRRGDRVVGILAIQSYSRNAFDQQDLETLQALADYCGGAFERIRAEEALRESQQVMLHQERLAAIGQLSSGAAHEFNNILTIIQGHGSLLLNERGLAPKVIASLREICGSAERAANLTRQLLTFSRKQFMRPQVLDLNETIREVVNMLSRVLGEQVVVKCDLANAIPPVRADSGMMEQIIMNLAVNARDAMARNGGELTISTGGMEVTCQHSHPEARPGNFVLITVSDTGCGMDAATLRHIFEPFFTTKGVGKGTGLGLASVYGIVKQHRGWLEAESEPGKGTSFRIYLPATEEVLAESPAVPEVPSASFPGATETILLVEDEAGLRKMVLGFLKNLGYAVLEAGDGKEALEIWQGRADEIDLLFTDMVLPGGISGRDVANRVRDDQPDLPVILTSGYSAEILGQDLHATESIVFVPKPYSPMKIGEIIRGLLDLRARSSGKERKAI